MPSTKRSPRVEPNGSHDVRQAAAGVPTAADLEDPTGAMRSLLHALQAMRVGDFSVRLPRDQVGLAGKIADTFNEIVAANERMAQQLEQVGQVVGREGKTRKRVRFGLPTGAWGEMEGSINTLIDDLLWPTTRADPRDLGGRAGRPAADRAARGRRAAARRASSCAPPPSSTP